MLGAPHPAALLSNLTYTNTRPTPHVIFANVNIFSILYAYIFLFFFRYEADQAGDKTACKGTMTTQPRGEINIRGANYLNDKVKYPHNNPVFRLLCVWNFTYKEAIQNLTSRITCVKEFFAKHPDREFFVNNRMIPTTPWQMTVEIYERPMSSKSTPQFEKLWAK